MNEVLNDVMLAGDMRSLGESMREFGEQNDCSIKAVLEYKDGATLTICYQHPKGGAA